MKQLTLAAASEFEVHGGATRKTAFLAKMEMLAPWVGVLFFLFTAWIALRPLNSLKSQIIGTWIFVVTKVKAPNSKISRPFRETPKGFVVFTAGLLLASSAWSQDAPHYQQRPASPDGTGKVYMGREISHVMGWQGAAWLEREEREREERTDLLLPTLDLKPGMAVADIGAGSGYFARRIAGVIGSKGSVYAVEVQPEMVRMLEVLAKRPGVTNIKPVQGAVADVKLQPASIDLALMVDVYHELEFPYEVLASVVRALKPGGRMVFVEYRAEDPNVPIKALHKMSEAQVKAEAARHALVWEYTDQRLPRQHVIIFRKK